MTVVKIRGHEIVFGFLIATVFWSGMLAWQSAPSAYGEICDEPKQGQSAANVDCARYHIVFVALWHVAKAFKNYDAAVTAAATVVIAFFTVTLWWSTRKMWVAGAAQLRHAEVTAERQLRAYVVVGGADIRLLNVSTIQANVTLKNTGQTPGYDLETWTAVKVCARNAPPFDERWPIKQRSIIGPGNEFHAPSDLFSVSQQDRAAIDSGAKLIFVWGEATYRDAFGKNWVFEFRARNSQLMITPRDGSGKVLWHGWGVSPHPDFGYQERESQPDPSKPTIGLFPVGL